MYIRLLIYTVLLFLWSFGESTLREMETPTKTVLVNMGENTRVVTFATSSDVDDAEALAVAIKTTFADILLPNQTFFMQIKSEEWAGVLWTCWRERFQTSRWSRPLYRHLKLRYVLYIKVL